jgi:hypothetical protein
MTLAVSSRPTAKAAPAPPSILHRSESSRAQTSLRVSAPSDPSEQEATATARRVVTMSAPGPSVSLRPSTTVISRREADGATGASSNVGSQIQASMSGGSPLPNTVRQFMEPRFKADFSAVRIHAGEKAATLNRKLNAHAFATGKHIFFARDRFRPETNEGKELIAHELTHTIQQRAVVQRAADVPVTQRTEPQVQREEESGDSGGALNYFADKANLIPGFRMFTIILGVNPINMSKVARSAANILRALIELLPMGGLITQALDSSGIFEKAGAFVEAQLGTLGMTGAVIKQAIKDFITGLSLWDLARPWTLWDKAKRIFTDPIDRIINFVKGLVGGIVTLIKEAILRPIAKLAEGTDGYALLKAVIGKDPITGDPYPQTAENLIGPFMKLIGQGEIWENMQKAKAIPRAFAWFKTAMSELMGFVREIPGLFLAAFKSLQLADIIFIPLAFGKIAKVFGGFLGRFFSWAGSTIWNLLEIIFAVVAPGVMPHIAKARAAFKTILKNPGAFVGNLVAAGKLGFQNFASNIGTHLKNALIKWLTAPLGEAGVYIPKSFALMEIVKLVLSVLGLTWQNIRAKLVKIIPDPVLTLLEKTAGVLVTLVKDGPVAAWEQIKTELEDLKGQLISQVTQMVTVEVVKAAVVKLVSMLNPIGAFVQAIIAIYNTVTFFIEKISQIAAVVASFIDSIAAIATGQIAGAAKRVEQTMANTLVVVIAFLAKFAGVGNIPEKLVGVVKKIRAVIDKGLDKIVAWLGALLKKIGGAIKSGAKALFQWWKKKAPFSGGGESHTVLFQGDKENAVLMVRTTPKKPDDFIVDYIPSTGSAADVTNIKNLSTAIDAAKKVAVAAQNKNPPDEAAVKKADDDLTQKFNALGQALAGLLDKSEDEGSQKNPVPTDYPKRRAAAYPNIYVGPESARFIDQNWLKAAAGASPPQAKAKLASYDSALTNETGFKNWTGVVKVFRAAGGAGQSLPNGSQVGLDPAFAALAPGKVLVYDEKGKTGGGGKINNLFKPFGFRAGKEGLDGDHVMERQLGGPDTISNLWPLQAGENRSSGSALNTMKVTFKSHLVTVHEARQQRKKKPLNLLIRSVK